MLGSLLSDQRWFQTLVEAQPRVAEILAGTAEQQQRGGYFHTLREILQQPSTWLTTAQQMTSARERLLGSLSGAELLVLTGSGSSEFVGQCVCGPLRQDLGICAAVVDGGTLLTYGADVLPRQRPGVVVSVGRSGDSPESVGALSRLLQEDANLRHLAITCNRNGALAVNFGEHPNVAVVVLDDATNDRSLVMTSSFTNLALAARSLAFLNTPERYRELCEKLSQVAAQLIRNYMGAIGEVASWGFARVVFLGSGSRLGAAHESSLKVLEMTAGAVPTLCHSYLGFRHGPMSFANEDTLMVCFLSSDPILRAYESDLIRELDQKKLGRLKIIVGEGIPPELLRENDLAVECPGLGEIGDENTPIIHVVVGQLLAFFRCLGEGLHPDTPSTNGVISRVVPGFRLHSSAADGNGR